jgi:hypothetical protein
MAEFYPWARSTVVKSKPEIQEINIMPAVGRGMIYRDRMSYSINRFLFIFTAHRLGPAAGALIARLHAGRPLPRNEHEEECVDAVDEKAGPAHRLKTIAALAAVLALSTGCGSSSSQKPPANKAPMVVNPGLQAGVAGLPARLQIAASDPD